MKLLFTDFIIYEMETDHFHGSLVTELNLNIVSN